MGQLQASSALHLTTTAVCRESGRCHKFLGLWRLRTALHQCRPCCCYKVRSRKKSVESTMHIFPCDVLPVPFVLPCNSNTNFFSTIVGSLRSKNTWTEHVPFHVLAHLDWLLTINTVRHMGSGSCLCRQHRECRPNPWFKDMCPDT